MGFDLWKLVLHVVRVHRLDLLARRCTEDLDNLDQLVNATLAGEQGLAKHQLCHDASCRPNIYAHSLCQSIASTHGEIDPYQCWSYSWSLQI